MGMYSGDALNVLFLLNFLCFGNKIQNDTFFQIEKNVNADPVKEFIKKHVDIFTISLRQASYFQHVHERLKYTLVYNVHAVLY